MSMLPLKSSVQVVRASSVLTGAYVPGTVITVDEHNFLGINIAYTNGDEDSLDVKIEVSTDGGTTWFQQVTETTTSGAIAVALATRNYIATGNYATTVYPIKVPTSDTADKGQVRVSFKATGGTPTGTASASLVTGWA